LYCKGRKKRRNSFRNRMNSHGLEVFLIDKYSNKNKNEAFFKQAIFDENCFPGAFHFYLAN
jgi:hypothetical protein